DEAVRAAVVAVASFAEVNIVSGRDLDDVIAHVDIPGIAYAGSHGFEVRYANGVHALLGEGMGYRAVLDRATLEVTERLAGMEGVIVERKRFATAVHYR